MLSYFLRRLGRAAITIVAVSLIVFVAVRATGDPTFSLVAEDATEAEIAEVRAELGLDRPYFVQYAIYVGDVISGDFGTSLRYKQPAFDLVVQRLPATLQLALAAFILSTVFGILLGILAALRQGRWPDMAIRAFAALGLSAPSFWVGILAILLFGVMLQWLPTSGRAHPLSLLLPAMTLALHSMASIVRLTRSAMLETSSAEYIKFLRSKGLPERLIIWKHALRNALVPIVAILGLQLSNLVGGAVIIEVVFNWPGVGRLMIEALVNHDFPVIQAGVLLITLSTVLVNLAIDMSYGVIDPRIKYQ
ncbi:ABC transporter permease [Sphingosinicella terrae]|uniref:ABC transporter permease n=1 Tax=Sphingosinicella terrae TaxID=2172047 RepID=UPI000E0DBA60|nr:ABC transporter permease [Sphingosinicella terrae]